MKGKAIDVTAVRRPQVQRDPDLAWIGPTASELPTLRDAAAVLVATIPSGYCRGCRCIRSAAHLQEGEHA